MAAQVNFVGYQRLVGLPQYKIWLVNLEIHDLHFVRALG